MENQNQFMQNYPQQGAEQKEQTMLPHSIAVLVCGILGIQCSFIYGIPGLAFSIVALILGNKSGNYLFQFPGMFTEGSIKMYRSGRTCAIIGLILSIVMIFVFIFLFYYLFTTVDHHNYTQPPPPPPPPPVYR
jgi:hypothetical protein